MDAQQLAQAIIQATAVTADPLATAQRRAEAVQFFEQVCSAPDSVYISTELSHPFRALCRLFLASDLGVCDVLFLSVAQARRDPLHSARSSSAHGHPVCSGGAAVCIHAAADPGERWDGVCARRRIGDLCLPMAWPQRPSALQQVQEVQHSSCECKHHITAARGCKHAASTRQLHPKRRSKVHFTPLLHPATSIVTSLCCLLLFALLLLRVNISLPCLSLASGAQPVG